MHWSKVLKSLAPLSLLMACAPPSPVSVMPPPPVIAPVGAYAPPAPAEYIEPPAYHRHHRRVHHRHALPVNLRRHVTRHHSGEPPASSPPNSPLPR